MAVPKKIVWLASYPKSGNTWFRAFLTALMNDGEININAMKTDGIFSSRKILDLYTDLDSIYLSDEESKLLQPEVFNALAFTYEKNRLFIKVHDAYTHNRKGLPIIPTEGTFAAVYILRNPLAVVPSLANHLNMSIDEAISFLNNKEACLNKQKDNLNTQLQTRQLLMNWSDHVNSWVKLAPFPIKIIKYEDMMVRPLEVFSDAVKFIGVQYGENEIKDAIQASSFDKLRQQESANRFKESPFEGNVFFRKGAINSWNEELSATQILSIKEHHKKTMEQFNYY